MDRAYEKLKAIPRSDDKARQRSFDRSVFRCGNQPHGYFESGFQTPTEFEINNLLGKNGSKIIEDGSLFRAARECLDFVKENFIR